MSLYTIFCTAYLPFRRDTLYDTFCYYTKVLQPLTPIFLQTSSLFQYIELVLDIFNRNHIQLDVLYVTLQPPASAQTIVDKSR
jgi:hypothetical protein